MKESERERMLELLADKAAFGLTEEDSREVEMLLNDFPEWENENSFEMAAAAIGLTNLDTSEQMPQNLRLRIAADAAKYFGAQAEKTQEIKNFALQAEKIIGLPVTQKVIETEPKMPLWNWLGWAFAATACIALAVNIWTTRFRSAEVVRKPETLQIPTPELTAAQKREQLLASVNKIQVDLAQPKPDAITITGDVVWDNTKQEGYIRFQDLPVNDSTKETYQLWIGDENQKNPVDGGIFTVTEKGEIIVPIKAKLKIGKPTMFAVTREKSGGVVVSDLKSLVAIAKV